MELSFRICVTNTKHESARPSLMVVALRTSLRGKMDEVLGVFKFDPYPYPFEKTEELKEEVVSVSADRNAHGSVMYIV